MDFNSVQLVFVKDLTHFTRSISTGTLCEPTEHEHAHCNRPTPCHSYYNSHPGGMQRNHKRRREKGKYQEKHSTDEKKMPQRFTQKIDENRVSTVEGKESCED